MHCFMHTSKQEPVFFPPPTTIPNLHRLSQSFREENGQWIMKVTGLPSQSLLCTGTTTLEGRIRGRQMCAGFTLLTVIWPDNGHRWLGRDFTLPSVSWLCSWSQSYGSDSWHWISRGILFFAWLMEIDLSLWARVTLNLCPDNDKFCKRMINWLWIHGFCCIR